jgi:hypothetical protein
MTYRHKTFILPFRRIYCLSPGSPLTQIAHFAIIPYLHGEKAMDTPLDSLITIYNSDI